MPISWQLRRYLERQEFNTAPGPGEPSGLSANRSPSPFIGIVDDVLTVVNDVCALSIKRAWSASSRTVTSCGLAPDVRSVQRFLVNRSLARPITPLAAARIVCVER